MEQNLDSLKKRAYHEAGHAVIAYLTGYSCTNLEITGKNPLENKENYDFGEDTHLISTIYQYRNNPDIYDNLSVAAKNRCRNVALKTIVVLMGGPASESVYKNDGKVELSPFFTIPVHDLNAADAIDYFLSIVKQGQHPTNYLQDIFRQVLKLMEIKEVWSAVSTLAKAVMMSEGRVLKRKDIEKILIETGFLHYLSNLKQKKSPNGQSSSVTSASSGFTREELEKLKKQCKKKPTVSKEDGVVKIINFAKNLKYGSFQIGLTENSENDLFQSGKVDENNKSEYIIIDTQSYSVAKEILMYFLCLGMEIVPGSSKSKDASTVYVLRKD